MTPTLVFDIETIPDTAGLRTLLDVPAHATDDDIANIAFHQRRQQNGVFDVNPPAIVANSEPFHA